ncbi:hypothetical protein Ae201684_005655 [Aphanomyces euteiches]|uniref:Uncharacterized protein n=1 Tax=Aphanomyces euteiches TaxID=100861 RepID=A0A6G0XE85_9STRA|nr:hypothetical protein Ae201684_005655 [Aphanomyces euteiches]
MCLGTVTIWTREIDRCGFLELGEQSARSPLTAHCTCHNVDWNLVIQINHGHLKCRLASFWLAEFETALACILDGWLGFQ